MNQVYDPMAFAKLRAEQKMQTGQAIAGAVKDLGGIASKMAETKSMLSDGKVKVTQARESAVNAVKTKLEPLVGAEKAQQIAEQSITIPQKTHWKDPGSYIDQLVLDAKGIEGIAANLKNTKERSFATGEGATTDEAFKQGLDISSPVVQYGIGRTQMGKMKPDMTSQEAVIAIGEKPVGAAEFAVKEAVTPAQRLAYEGDKLTAEQKAEKERRDRAEKADAAKRKEVQTNLTRERENLSKSQKAFTEADGSYSELKSAMDAVNSGESVPGEFYLDQKNNVRFKSVDQMREELTRREDALDLAKKSRNASKSAIEKWQNEDSLLSRRIEREIEVEQQTAQEKQNKLKSIVDAIVTIPQDKIDAIDSDPAKLYYHAEKVMRDAGIDDTIIGRVLGQLKKGVKITEILDAINSQLSE